MADEKLNIPHDESKKDTVRINLPKPPVAASSATVRMEPTPVPNAKKDTARLQPTAAKPTTAEMPRPTVKLKREEPTVEAVPVAAPVPVAVAEVDSSVSGLDLSLALVAMVLALAVAGYIFSLNQG